MVAFGAAAGELRLRGDLDLDRVEFVWFHVDQIDLGRERLVECGLQTHPAQTEGVRLGADQGRHERESELKLAGHATPRRADHSYTDRRYTGRL